MQKISGIERITDNLYMIPGEGTATFPFCHSYLYNNDDFCIIFDPQCGRKQLKQAFDQIGKTFADLDIIINTHFHLDHSGSNFFLKKISGAKILIHEADAIALEHLDAYIERYGMENKEMEKDWRTFLKNFGFKEIIPDQTLKDGDIVPGDFQVVHTPGHAPGHCCFYKAGILISGDIDLTSPWIGNLSCNIADYLNSIEKLKKFRIIKLLPAHGLPVFENIPERLEAFQHRLLDRVEKTYNLLTDTPLSLDQITQLMFHEYPEEQRNRLRRRQAQFTFHFGKITCLNHLKYLKIQNRVKNITHDGQELWQKLNSD
ncbi:MAG TPA: MBL fold metallo-hydrolase [Candidatus Deferrimicrobium sp.]|nr:MBL fold metallo-hydrolase [Candidatus Deferrimicrobium sp.]